VISAPCDHRPAHALADFRRGLSEPGHSSGRCARVTEIVRATQEDAPPGETHWSCRTMAKAQGVSPATVQRIWSARGPRTTPRASP